VLRAQPRDDSSVVRRFLREAQHLAQLRHPHIVAIHEVGDAGGEPYFAMDYVEGESLAARLKRGPLPPSHAVALLKQLAEAVQHAHRHGIIHRDLKPANVLVDRQDRAYVTDFGLARDRLRAAHLTQSGTLLGTPQYMAPEQARGESALVGEATDIHALGMILYEMLVGQPPYGRDSTAETLARILHEPPLPLRKHDRRIPRDLETICLKMLQKEPTARYASASTLLEDLRRYEAGLPLIARRPGLVARVLSWGRRHLRTLGLLAAAVCLAWVVAAWMLDPSYEALRAWGDEEAAHGRQAMAAQIYLRAWQRSSAAQRTELTERLVAVARALDDPALVLKIAEQVLPEAPEVSFGRHDYLVAQAAVARLRSGARDGLFDPLRDAPPDDLRHAEQRIEQALQGVLSPTQREELLAALQAVELALSRGRPYVRGSPRLLAKLPVGSVEELQRLRQDPQQPIWNRGKAAMAVGNRYIQEGDPQAALVAFLEAHEHFRRVFPYLGGVTAIVGLSPSQGEMPDAEECQLVRDLVAQLVQHAPERFGGPPGGLTFSVVGTELAAGVGLHLDVVLCDPDLADPDQGLPSPLPRRVPLRQDRPVSIPMLDGTYRLTVRGHHARWDRQHERFVRLLQVDVEGWPQEVTIEKRHVALPPVHLRLAEEIALVHPPAHAPVVLAEAELAWHPVAGADHYIVQLSYLGQGPSPTQTYFLSPRTTETRLRFASLPEAARAQLTRHFAVGRTGSWRVDAYDRQGRRVGTSLEDRRLLVLGGWGEPPPATRVP